MFIFITDYKTYLNKFSRLLVPPVEEGLTINGNFQTSEYLYTIHENFIKEAETLCVIKEKLKILSDVGDKYMDIFHKKGYMKTVVITLTDTDDYFLLRDLKKELTKLYDELDNGLLKRYLGFDKSEYDFDLNNKEKYKARVKKSSLHFISYYLYDIRGEQILRKLINLFVEYLSEHQVY